MSSNLSSVLFCCVILGKQVSDLIHKILSFRMYRTDSYSPCETSVRIEWCHAWHARHFPHNPPDNAIVILWGPGHSLLPVNPWKGSVHSGQMFLEHWHGPCCLPPGSLFLTCSFPFSRSIYKEGGVVSTGLGRGAARVFGGWGMMSGRRWGRKRLISRLSLGLLQDIPQDRLHHTLLRQGRPALLGPFTAFHRNTQQAVWEFSA